MSTFRILPNVSQPQSGLDPKLTTAGTDSVMASRLLTSTVVRRDNPEGGNVAKTLFNMVASSPDQGYRNMAAGEFSTKRSLADPEKRRRMDRGWSKGDPRGLVEIGFNGLTANRERDNFSGRYGATPI